jgi:hypothetical protein
MSGRKIKRERRDDCDSLGAPCKLCGEFFIDPLSMLLHLATNHPVQLAQHPAAQKALISIQSAAYEFGGKLAEMLKGK